MITVIAVGLAAQPAPAAAPAPAGAVVEERPKLLILDFRDDGVGANVVRVIHDTLASHLSRDQRLEVLSSEDVRRTLDVESQKRALGCADDESCLAEIAGALGARLLLHGTAGKLGDLVIVNVSLFDAQAQKSVGRETIEVPKLDELPAPLRAAGDRLVARLVGPSKATSSGPPNAVLLWTGVGVGALGVVGLVVGGFMAIDGSSKLTRPDFRTREQGKLESDVGIPIAIAGAVCAGLGGVLLPIAYVTE